MRLSIPILVTPLIALAQQSANYALVPLACAKQQHLVLHIVFAASLALVIGATAMAWRVWREAGADAPGDHGDPASRTRFLAMLGIMVSALMALTILAQWLMAAFIPPCVQ
jgi:hypothetical protein